MVEVGWKLKVLGGGQKFQFLVNIEESFKRTLNFIKGAGGRRLVCSGIRDTRKTSVTEKCFWKLNHIWINFEHLKISCWTLTIIGWFEGVQKGSKTHRKIYKCMHTHIHSQPHQPLVGLRFFLNLTLWVWTVLNLMPCFAFYCSELDSC